MSNLTEKMKENISIWGRDLEVDVIFECYGKDGIADTQEQTYENIKDNWGKYSDLAYNAFVEYLKKNYSDELEDGEVKNIFKYIVPREIYIKQYTEDKTSFGIIGHFKFDKDNGIAVRFVDGKVKAVGSELIM